MSPVGKIGPFDLTKDNWELYVERLEQYFIANDVKDAVKVATLITVVGNEAYEMMVNLCTPIRPAKKTFAELIKVMQLHLQPKPSILAERYKFRQTRQKQDESIIDYVAQLKRMSISCGFDEESLSENLRDQIVCGLRSDYIRQRLFAEENVTFERAFKLAVTLEAAESDAAAVEVQTGPGASASGTPVHQILPESRKRDKLSGSGRHGAQKEWSDMRNGRVIPSTARTSGPIQARTGERSRARSDEGGQCRACGGYHDTNSCKYKVFVCRVCMQQGHLKKVCPKLRQSTLYQNDVIQESSDDSDEVNNYSIKCDLKYYEPYVIKMNVNGISLPMEIDTGSIISCVSLETFYKYFKGTQLQKSKIKIRYYTGELVEPEGMLNVNVRHGQTTKTCKLYVVDGGKTSLLGRQWLHELKISWPVVDCNKVDKDGCCKGFNFDNFSTQFCEVFEDGLGRFTGGTVGFHLRPGARPVFMRARPLAYALREPVERALDDLVRDGVITPVDTSDWATPIVPVMKKDGGIRVCGDFKLTLNKCLEVDRFPLPRVEDLLTKLHKGDKFTKLDLSQAYAQFELNDDSKKYTVINTHKGLFRYERLIYGLASSPAIFQKKIEQLFSDMPRVGIFLDDVIITGENDREHIETLTKVFERLQKYGLKIKKQKCTFFADSVTYLGFVISKDGVHTCPDKIEAIKNAPKPTNVTELRAFIGLVMYYAKFVPNISTILAPMYRLLRKEVSFCWEEQCEVAFRQVKEMLVSSKILAHYSPELPLVLTTDASSVGVGAVISHLFPGSEGEEGVIERPIAYASRALNNAEKNYSQIEREALSIIFGIRKFHQYLYGRKFILKTDHKPLVSIFGDKSGIPVMAASRMQRWAVMLAGYDYDIEYVRSEKNAADALSRLPVGPERKQKAEVTYVNFVQNSIPITRKDLINSTKKDVVLNKVINYLQTGWPSSCNEEDIKPYYMRRDELYLDMGCVVWGYRLVIPKDMRSKLLDELHVGHMGIVKMKCIARSYMWWPGIDADVERRSHDCATCVAESSAPPRAPPRPWPYPAEPWSRIHLDFLGPFHGKTFLVLIDAHSKWLEIFPMQKTTASTVIGVLRETFARFGLPKEVVSDNGPPFNSKEYSEFMHNNGIQVNFSAVYHPASNGAAEAAVKLCKRAMKKALRDGQDVNIALQAYLMAYRNVEQESTGVAPAVLLQRRKLRTRLDLLLGGREVEDRVRQKQGQQVEYKGGTDRSFKVGDEVWARNYGEGDKWVSGKVEEKIGSRTYVVGRENDPSLKRHVDQIRNRWSNMFELPRPNIPSTAEVQRRVAALGVTCASPPRSPRAARGEGERPNSAETPAVTSSPEVVAGVAPVELPKRIRKPVRRYGFEID